MPMKCRDLQTAGIGPGPFGIWRMMWPWDSRGGSPKTRRHDLIRAGALIVAEIERIDRDMAKYARITLDRARTELRVIENPK